MTSLTHEDPPPTDEAPIPLLPERPRRAGPVTAHLLRRTALVVLAVEVIGTALLLVGGRTASTAGTSLVVPGGGLLYTGRPILFAITVALVALSVVLWWAVSVSWGIPLVWLASGALAVGLDHAPGVLDSDRTWGWAIAVDYVIAAGCVAVLAWSFERRFRAKRALVPELNDYLRTAIVPAPSRPQREPDDVDAELLRWCYELALQPLDQFRGFEWGEQFHGGTCVRYQLNYLGWALAVYAANYVPNAPQAIEEVLRNLVLKQTDLRVWGVLAQPQPHRQLQLEPRSAREGQHHAVRFTGDQINMYEAATGSTIFDEPGSLTFVWKDGRTFAYDHHTWMEAVRRNFDESRLCFFPCEPGWAFAACNTIGAQALRGYEALHGTRLWRDLEPRWRSTLLDEYMMPDGNYVNIRCTRTGLSWIPARLQAGST